MSRSEVEVERLDEIPPAWDAFVSTAARSSYVHLSGWKAVMESALGHRCVFLVATGPDGTWRGVLPLVHVRSRLFGHYLISLPFLNAGGPLGDDAAVTALVDSAVEEARVAGVELLELRSRHSVPAPVLQQSGRKITVELGLPSAAEDLWRQFPAKLRSQIRKPMKAGFEVRFGLQEADAFYPVFARHMRDLGTPVLPRTFFDAIAHTFSACVVFGSVHRDGEPLAVGCGFVWREAFELTWASALRQYQADAPNMLLYWGFMQQAIGHGLTRFDFGRCTAGGGTHRFKRQWGGHDIPLPWLQWSRAGVVSPPSLDRPLYRVAAAAWSRLPVAVANRLGPQLARVLP